MNATAQQEELAPRGGLGIAGNGGIERRRTQRLLPIAATAAIYFVASRLTLLLAIPPGYATAVWPGAGIALASVILFGPAVSPGIFVGSFFVNAWTVFDAGDPGSIARSLAGAFAIAAGATLQALVAARLVRPLSTPSFPFAGEKEVIGFLALSGPVSCLVNATWSVSALWLMGIASATDVPFNWFTWWVGDTIGTLVFAPLILLWAAPPSKAGRGRAVRVSIPLSISFALSVVLFLFVSHWERQRLQLDFERRTDALAEAFRRSLGGNLATLEAVDGLFASGVSVDRTGFQIFTKPLLGEHPGIRALAWDARVSAAKRFEFEEAGAREHPHFEITEAGTEGNLVRAAERAEYVAVRFIEPAAGNERALGFDVFSKPERGAVLRRAGDEGRTVVTKPLRLVQDVEGAPDNLLLFRPVYAGGVPQPTLEARRRSLVGYAAAVLRVSDILATAIPEGHRRDVSIELVDETDGDHPIFLARTPSDETSVDATKAAWIPKRSVAIDVGDRQWTLGFRPTSRYAVPWPWQAWSLLAAALSFTALLEAFLLLLTGRAARIEEVVHLRTLSFDRANRDLQQQIEERRKAESALLERQAELELAMSRLGAGEERFRGFIESAPDAIIICDGAGRITLTNAQTERLFGYEREEMLGKTVELLIPPRFRDAHVAHRRRYSADPKVRPMGTGLELYGRRKDGTEFPVEVSLSALRFDDGTFVVSAVRDVTDRKRFERELQAARDAALESARLKSAFLANMSHEIRTPLNVILGHTQLLAESLGDRVDESTSASLEALDHGGRRLLELIRGVLDMSKLESRSFETKRERIDLPSLVRELLDDMRVLATAKNLELSFVCEEPEATVFFDRYCLSQALTNLLSNAIKFTETGEVRVRLYRGSDANLRIEVRDTGIGINAAFLPRLFEPFTQADVGFTRRFEGSGLGLALTKRYLELNDADISVESVEGRGTVFVIRIPRSSESGR